MPSDRATDLRAAYRATDVQPLKGDDLDRYYTELGKARKVEAMRNMSLALEEQQPGEFSTFLFTGHRGCGKSTELRLLERQWRQQYRVIYLEVDEVTDINDVEYTDLYLLVAQYVEFELRKLGIPLDPRIVKDFEDWFKEVTHETEQSVESSISVAGEVTLGAKSPFPIPFLAKLLAKLISQIKGGSKDKTTIRQTLEKDFSRLKTTLNLLLDDANEKLREKYPACKSLLLIFDNLDRCPLKVSNSLFFDYATQLQELRCTIVYTVPISALYSPNAMMNNFQGEVQIVPMVSIYEFKPEIRAVKSGSGSQLFGRIAQFLGGVFSDRSDLRSPLKDSEVSYNDAGIQALVALLERRMDTKKIFASEQELHEIIRASGGHVRHLMQIVREACLTALGRGHSSIEAEDALYAIKQLQFTFERQIPYDHYPAIAKTFRTKKAINDEVGQLTLFNTSVLEYNGNSRWNYPHPLVQKIDAFQQALQELVSQS